MRVLPAQQRLLLNSGLINEFFSSVTGQILRSFVYVFAAKNSFNVDMSASLIAWPSSASVPVVVVALGTRRWCPVLCTALCWCPVLCRALRRCREPASSSRLMFAFPFPPRPLPLPAAASRVSFRYEQLIYTAALPRLAAGAKAPASGKAPASSEVCM